MAAVSGVVLLGFLVLHVSGNLKAFAGAAAGAEPAMDEYAVFLREVGAPLVPREGLLWAVRVVLLGALGLHVVSVAQLVARNRAARPARYEDQHYQEASLSARTMLVSGLLLLLFVTLHILHFTTGTLRVGRFEHMEVYANLWHAFRHGWVALGYVAFMAVLGFHLFHGAWSLFQTLGADRPDRNPGLRRLAAVLAVVLFLGFSAVPAAFWLGALPPPPANLAGGP